MLLKPYPEYKDSGVAWLGKVPAHWKVLPNRAFFREVNERNHPDEEMLSVTISAGVLRQAELLAASSKKDSSNEDKSNYKLVVPGDITYNKMRAWQGAIGVSGYRGIISPAYVVVRLRNEGNPTYYHHLLRTPQFAKEAERWSYGITSDQWSLRAEDFKRIYCIFPPDDEQQRIVRFVNLQDQLMNRLIRTKQRMIELLNEQKQAIIHQAVTRGLDPDVPMKPTGLDGLTEVPEHWEIVPFKTRVGFQEGPGIMATDFRDQGVPLLRIAGLASEEASLEGCNFLDPEMVALKWQHFAIKPGDYLLSASASTGTISRATETVAGSIPYTGIIRLWKKASNTNMEYISSFINSRAFISQIDAAKSGVGIEHFGPTHLKRMWLCVPRLREQEEIAAHITRENAFIERAIQRSHREIDLIREYRTRLISDVVIGKLDVRGVDLPEVVEEEAGSARLDPDGAGGPGEPAMAQEVSHADH